MSFDVHNPGKAQHEKAKQKNRQERRKPAYTPPTPPQPQPTPQPTTAPTPPPMVILPRNSPLQNFNLKNLPRRRPDHPSQEVPAPAQQAYGPAAPSSSPGDTPIVGTAPDGSPLYKARWYRKPTDAQLSGYLSTANPNSYALIECKTAPHWRVEDCRGLEEYPAGSHIQRAVLAAAWQFQVRPPMRDGQYLVGAWVRILIEYTQGPSSSYGNKPY